MNVLAALALACFFASGCATPNANSPVINIYKIVNNGIFSGDCLKDDNGEVVCPSVTQNAPIETTYTTTSDIKPKSDSTQTTTASPTLELKGSLQ